MTIDHPSVHRFTIDFKSNIPFYVQLMNIMNELIRDKTWKPSSQIPGELDLCEEYGISRTVVRQALRELEFSGIITRRKGKGTFVAEPKINEGLAQKLTGFYQDMVEQGLKPITKVLHQRVIPSNEKVSGFLQIPVGTAVFDINRLRSVEDAPIQLVTTFIPYDLCPKLAEVDLTNRSLYAFLEEECGVFISYGRRYLEAVAANDQEAKLLLVERGAPMVMLDSISYQADGRPVEYYHAVHRGDRSRFEVELVRYREPGKGLDDSFLKAGNLPQSNPFLH